MNVEQLREYCLSISEDVEEKMPFQAFNGAKSVLVFYVCGHMFCSFDIDKMNLISVKCQIEKAIYLKEHLEEKIVYPYNKNKFWIGIIPNLTDNNLIRELILNSYNIVKEKYSPTMKKLKKRNKDNRTTDEITKKLFALQDTEYRKFQKKIIPGFDIQRIIGVRTPLLKQLSKELIKTDNVNNFLQSLPHKYFDQNQLHAFIINEIKNFDTCINEIEKFLPYIDNWATCDQLSPKCLKKNRKELLKHIKRWIKSKKEYTVRFGIGMLMQHFLEEDFNERYLYMVADIKQEEYYIKMMQAWYFATALAKRYEQTLPVLQNCCLDKWTHNKTIQKAIESFRILPQQKEYLKTLKIKENG